MSGSKNYDTFTQWNTTQKKERRSSVGNRPALKPPDRAPTLCNSMDGSGQPYAQRSKPGGEIQIPYDLTHKWNIINKTNKQAKYNQRSTPSLKLLLNGTIIIS